MNKVTLYQVNKTEKIVSGDHLELSSYGRDQITHIRNSDEFIIQKDINVQKLQTYLFRNMYSIKELENR